MTDLHIGETLVGTLSENIVVTEVKSHSDLTDLDYENSGHTGFASSAELAGKVDKVSGKGLSTNDYTNNDKQKVQNAISDAPSDNKQYARKNGNWEEVQGGGYISWNNVTDKPSTFPPSTHTHDDRYYTESEVDILLSDKADSDDIPTKTSELTNDSGFLTEHQSLAAYRTSASQDIIDAGKQNTLTAGTGISIVNDVISNTQTSAEWGNITGTLSDQTDLQDELDGKQGVISDLSTIRSGAASGATAVQPSAISDMATKTWTEGQGYLTEHQSLSGYATESWVENKGYGTYSKPAGGIPSSDMTSAVQTSLGKADSALQEHQSLSGYATESWVEGQGYLTEHQSLAAYRTSAAQDVIDSGKQAVIDDLSTIRSGAALGATALQSVPNTYRTASAQDIIDNGKQPVINASNKLPYAYLSGTPTIPTVPTNVSAFTNDAGYLTQHQSLSAYRTASAQDAIDNGKQAVIDSSNKLPYSYISGTPTNVSSFTNDAGYLTEHQSLAAYRTASAQDTIDAGKQDVIDSTHKLPYAYLSGTPTIPTVPTNVSAFTNDAGYLTQHQSLSAYRTASAQDVIDNGKLPTSQKGAANGLAELDATGHVPSSQLPSYVDDVLEYSSTSAFPATGETGKIYIATDTNLSYRWTGTGYAEISPSLALGETSSTAYRGDRGKTAYDHSQDATVHVTAEQKSTWDAKGTYSKPSGGIPQSDLASAVQEKLHTVTVSSATDGVRLIDGDFLSAKTDYSGNDIQETYATKTELTNGLSGKEASGTAASAVSSHNSSASAHSDIRTAIGAKYTKPASGIPESDLASAVAGKLHTLTTDEHEVTQIDLMDIRADHDKNGNTLATQAYVNSHHDSTKQDVIPANTYDAYGAASSAVSTHNSASDAHSSLFNAKQNAITSSNKLAYSLISGTPTNVSSFTNDSGYITSSYHDSTKQDTISDLATIRSNASSGASKVSCTDATVGGFGYTKNAGTITGITMNGSSKGTSGVVDLGTVLTAHQSLSNYYTKSEVNALLPTVTRM